MAVMPQQEPGQPPGSLSAAPQVTHGPAPAWRQPRRPDAALRVVVAAGLALALASIGARAAAWGGPGTLPAGLRALVGAGLAVLLALTALRAAGREGRAALPAVLAWTPYAARPRSSCCSSR